MSSLHSNSISHSTNENLMNGGISTKMQNQQQQHYPLKDHIMDNKNFLPPNMQNFRLNAVSTPSQNFSLSASSFSLPPAPTSMAMGINSPQQQIYAQQQQNVPLVMQKQPQQYPNNIMTNGGGDSTHSSRTGSPALNKSAIYSPSKTTEPPSDQLNGSWATKNNSSTQSQPHLQSSLSNVTGVGINKPTTLPPQSQPSSIQHFQNGSNLNDNMKNLSLDQNSVPLINGFQQPLPSPPSNNCNNYYSQNSKINNSNKMSPLNNQQQQPSPQNLDNHTSYKNSAPPENSLSMNRNNHGMPVGNNSLYNQQAQQLQHQLQKNVKSPSTSSTTTTTTMEFNTNGPVTLTNYENKNFVEQDSLQKQQQFSRNDINSHNSNSHIFPPPPSSTSSLQQQQQQKQQPKVTNSYLADNKQQQQPGMPPSSAAAAPMSVSSSSSSIHQHGMKRPHYPSPVTSPQQQQQQYQQPYDHQQQQQRLRNLPPPPSLQSSSSSTVVAPTFTGQTNIGPLKNPSQVPISTATFPSYGNYQQQHQQQSVTKQGFNKLWGQDVIDLMQHRHILPHDKYQPPRIVLNNQFYESVNCNPDIMRCTLSKIPESNNLLQKSRLPLGILIHPFRDINSLPVIQCPNIVRCRLCRAYINPFVYFVDSKMWKCNLCYRVNELPEDFQYDPATKTYGDVTRRPEVRSSTIEFIAPSEYMLRPPQPAIYLFLFDVSILAQQSGYLEIACATLLKYLDDMPGDARTSIGFIAFNSELHFYNIAEGFSQPHEMTLIDIDDPFLPRPDNLLVNLKENKELIKDLLNQLPTRFQNSHDPGSALGAALQVAYKLMSATGGRVTVFQTCLPNKGPGALQPREDPNNRSSKDVMHLNPATDFYKRHALECSGYQIAVDLFVLNQQYCDLATISGISKYSGGSIYHFPLYQKTKPQNVDSLKQCLKRYLTRKIGFEAVMRIRCTRGLQVHTFHGNFFVRSTDLLSLPNVNPDAGYGMQISYEESLTDIKTICFQSALLYTNSEGERRIRVHTLCLPVSTSLHEIMHSADPQAIVSLLSKMAVDRCMSSSVSDARDAFINATIDIIQSFRIAQNLPQGQSGQLIISKNLSLLPLYISALLKHVAFRIGTSTRLDDRIAAMDCMKTLPLDQLMKTIYPEYYIIDGLFMGNITNDDSSTGGHEGSTLSDNINENMPPLLQLSAEYVDSRSMFLVDSGPLIIIYIGLNVPPNILENVLGVQNISEIPDYCYGLKLLNTPENCILRKFIDILNEDKPYLPTIQIIRDTSTCRNIFVEKLIDDRSESSLSYYEFLQHLRSQIK